MIFAFIRALVCSVILCQFSIKRSDLSFADTRLMQFCELFEEPYGSDKCTPNMHLHGHIADCILDYGPIGSFWAFAFEKYRYNGVLESFVNNWISPEQQMMNKFLSYQEMIASDSLQHTSCEFSGLCVL